MPALLEPWAPVEGPADSWTASAPTYERGPVLLLTVTRSRVDGLWHAVIEDKKRMAFDLTRRSPSPFATRRLAEQWAEHEAEVMAAGMMPFPPGGAS
jgi:hypothetical protein